jgi:hypothetical protein
MFTNYGETGERKDGDMEDTRNDESNVDNDGRNGESNTEGNTYAK